MSTPAEQSIEEKVRAFSAAGMSTREIAAATKVSQSTVVRHLQRINSGPMRVLSAVTRTRVSKAVLVTAVLLLLTAFLVLTAAVATLAWR
jgi:transposase